jgi:TrpR family trp operon transcriptional repressor
MQKYPEEQDKIFEFIIKVANLKDSKEQKKILDIMLTPAEKSTITQRISLIEELLDKEDNHNSQREICKKLKMGIATVTRGNRIFLENKLLFLKVLRNEFFRAKKD